MQAAKRSDQSPRTKKAQKNVPERTTEDLRAASGRNLANLATCRQRQSYKDTTSTPKRRETPRPEADSVRGRLRGAGPFETATRTGRPPQAARISHGKGANPERRENKDRA